MDVINPELLWIDNRCYRLPVLDPTFNGGEENIEKDGDNWEAIEAQLVCTEEEPCDADYEIEETSGGRFRMKVSIPRTFWSFIIGSKGTTRKRIENDTKCILMIPRQVEANPDITITGPTKRSVILARRNVDVIVASSRQKLPFTHFISIPMNSSGIKENFLEFKDLVLKSFGDDRGVESSIFQNPDKLHLTVGTLTLADAKERELASNKLKEVCDQIIKPLLSDNNSCVIEMRGIEYMNDDPYEVDVLYGKVHLVDEGNLLQEAANAIVQHFVDTGFLKKEDIQEVKLHVTLMNTLFRDEKKNEITEEQNSFGNNKSWRNKKQRTTFNASNVLKRFKDFYFGKQEFKEIHLSLRYSTSSNGYYESSYIAKL